jgi:hypothetical protein
MYVKVKQSHNTPKEAEVGGRYSSYSFKTLALDGGEWSASCPGRALPPGKGSRYHWTEGCVGPRTSLDTEVRGKILLPLLGIEPRSPGHPVRSQTLYWLSYPGSIHMYTIELHIISSQYKCYLLNISNIFRCWANPAFQSHIILYSCYTRRFSTVEACCKSLSGDAYVGIPPDESFVKAMHTEVGLIDAGTILEWCVAICWWLSPWSILLGITYGRALAGHLVYLAN